MGMKHDPSSSSFVAASRTGRRPGFFWQSSGLVGASLIVGLGWLPFPFDVRLIWTMAAETLLLSLGIVALVLFGIRLRHGLLWPGLLPVLLTLLWFGLGAFDLQQAILCMKTSGQW